MTRISILLAAAAAALAAAPLSARPMTATDMHMMHRLGLPEKPQTGSGRTYDQLFVRHWDTWAIPGVKSRLFAFSVAGGKLAGGGVPIEGNLVGDTPSKPFGGGEELAFSPDGKALYFAL